MSIKDVTYIGGTLFSFHRDRIDSKKQLSALGIMGGLQQFIICLLCFLLPICNANASDVDSLKIAISSEDRTIKTHALLELSWLIRHEEPDSALLLINIADSIAMELLDTNAIITAHIRKGVLLRNASKSEEAALLFDKALTLAKQQQDSLAMVRALINAGQNHKLRGEIELSIRELMYAIKLLENTNQFNYLNVAYSTLAGLYIQLNRHENAINIYQKLLTQCIDLNDQAGICKSNYNLGVTYFEMGNNTIAKDYLDKALVLAIRLNDPMHKALVSNVLGGICFEQGNNVGAIKYYEQALPLCIKYDMQIEQASLLNNLAATFESMGQWSKSLDYYMQAADLAMAMGNRTNLHRIYLNLSQTYESIGQTDSALSYYQLHSLIKDSLFNEESNRQIVEVQEKYESAKKDKSIALLKAVESSQQADLERRQMWLIAAVLIAVVLAIALGIYLSKLHVQRTLIKKNEELYQQNTLRLVNENAAKSMNAHLAGETAERKRLASELHDRLSSQLATVKLYYDQLEEIKTNDVEAKLIKKASMLLGKSCTDVRKIAHDLAADTLHEFGLEAAVADLANTVSESGKFNLHLQAIAMDNRLPFTMELVLFRAIQELITNVIKHANASEVLLELKGLGEQIEIKITDNGKGFDSDTSSKNYGFGLRTIHERITRLGGQFSITSKKNSGTKVHITIPQSTLH